jgi:hypothetical protein
MKSFRAIFTLACMTLLGPAWAEVRVLPFTQQLEVPDDPKYQFFNVFGRDVAIDGGAIIVLTQHNAGQSALLYRREGRNGPWRYRRDLLTVGGYERAQVRMKNGIAAVQFGSRVWLFESTDGNYRLAQTAGPIRHPGGIAISGNSILIGGDNCDYDAVVYQKGSDGLWGITGRMDDNQGECRPEGLAVELNYDHALLRVPVTNQVTTWRRNGTALDWVPAGSLELPPAFHFSDRPLALQGSTAVTPDYPSVIRRSGTTWTPTSIVTPLDDANSSTTLGEVTYRDGVLLINEYGKYPYSPRMSAYHETVPGQFEHVGILPTGFRTREQDFSGRTVVFAGDSGENSTRYVLTFDLPSPLMAPPHIANDFEMRDLSDFTFDGGAFALATRGTNDVLARTDINGLAFALVNGSEWTDQQRIEADIAPTFSSSTGRAGLVVRYIDPNNYYFLAMRPGGILRLYRMLDGVESVLWQRATGTRLPGRVALAADGARITVYFNDAEFGEAPIDRELRPGRAGLATFQTRTDFDNVYVTAIPAPVSLMEKDFPRVGHDSSEPFTQIGGDWRVIWDEVANTNIGIAQLDASGRTLAFNGVPVRNQKIVALARLNSFNSPPEDAWFGLLARYVDTRTYYYVSVRSTNRIDIRKKVNGVITVLATANFTAVPERDYQLRFSVIDDQLQVVVDGLVVASARDDEIRSGQYGIATFRATALWRYIGAFQP